MTGSPGPGGRLAAVATVVALTAVATLATLTVPAATAGAAGPPAVTDPPTAEFDYTPAQPTVGTTVRFDARDSADPDGSIVAYRWDFDGDGSVDRNVTEPTVEYAYDAAGTYNATLTVVDDDGRTATAVLPVGVEDAHQPPVAACSVSPRAVTAGQSVTIDASGSERAESVRFDVDGDGSPDGPPREDFRVTVEYDEAGEYAPRVVALGEGSDGAGCGTVVVRNATTAGGNATGSGVGGDGTPVALVVGGLVLGGVLVGVGLRIRRGRRG